jgi:hypothetical protein
VGKIEGKKPIGKPRSRFEDNSRMDLQEEGWEGMDWIDLSQNRGRRGALVKAITNFKVHKMRGIS